MKAIHCPSLPLTTPNGHDLGGGLKVDWSAWLFLTIMDLMLILMEAGFRKAECLVARKAA